MREILFRGKMISGQWVYGDLRQYPNGNTAIRSNDYASMMAVLAETVGQYTGLTDKNGKKIFEGDEVQAFLSQTDSQAEYVWPVRVIVYQKGSFGLDDRHGMIPFHGFDPRVEFEIVGNVFNSVEE